MKTFIIIILSLCPIVSSAQNSSENWRVFLNSDTIPLKMLFDTSENTLKVNPTNDHLRLFKFQGQPVRGKIKFISGKGVPSGINYPLKVASYKINEETIVELRKVAKAYTKESLNGLYIQLVEVYDRTIRPIIIIQFNTE